MRATRRRVCAALAAVGCAVGVAACGDDEEPTPTPAAERPADDLQPIKDFLLEHTERLSTDATKLREQAEAYYALAEGADFDYAKLLQDKRADVKAFVEQAQQTFADANPAYEEMEGVVAGVPSLADFDVIIDAGADKSDPENAAPFTLETPGGKTFDRPGNFNYLIETSAFGTEPRFAAKGVEPDLDGDGKVSFGEAVPDADFYVTAAREFEKTAQGARRRRARVVADAAGRVHGARRDDADDVGVLRRVEELALRRGRQGAGEGVRRRVAAAGHRRHPRRAADRLRGRRPRIAEADAAQAKQTEQDLDELTAFAARLRDEEAGGKQFTADQAETLGAEAQTRAEAIAGQVSQAAGRLDIELET